MLMSNTGQCTKPPYANGENKCGQYCTVVIFARNASPPTVPARPSSAVCVYSAPSVDQCRFGSPILTGLNVGRRKGANVRSCDTYCWPRRDACGSKVNASCCSSASIPSTRGSLGLCLGETSARRTANLDVKSRRIIAFAWVLVDDYQDQELPGRGSSERVSRIGLCDRENLLSSGHASPWSHQKYVKHAICFDTVTKSVA